MREREERKNEKDRSRQSHSQKQNQKKRDRLIDTYIDRPICNLHTQKIVMRR